MSNTFAAERQEYERERANLEAAESAFLDALVELSDSYLRAVTTVAAAAIALEHTDTGTKRHADALDQWAADVRARAERLGVDATDIPTGHVAQWAAAIDADRLKADVRTRGLHEAAQRSPASLAERLGDRAAVAIRRGLVDTPEPPRGVSHG